MRVIVTGATGCIGRSLIKYFEKNEIHALILMHKGSERNAGINSTKYIKTDYCDIDEYDTYSCENSYDIFIHMAWIGGADRNNVEVHYKNVKYCIEALKLAKRLGCNRFVFTGSQAECGVLKDKIDGNSPCYPLTAFGASKLYAGYMTRFLSAQYGMEHIWCRILSVYGPYDRSTAMVTSVLNRFLSNDEVKLTKCEQQWDFIYSDDAAEAVFLCASKGKNGKIYPIGSGDVRELKSFIYNMYTITNSSSLINFGVIPYSENQVMFLGANTDELKEDTGFFIKTSFENGIKETVLWLKNNKDL